MDLNRIKSIFADYPEIKLVYLFGSRAKGIAGRLSDYDFAVYCDGKDKYRIYEIRLELFDKISRYLKTDRIDIVILNLTKSPELNIRLLMRVG